MDELNRRIDKLERGDLRMTMDSLNKVQNILVLGRQEGMDNEATDKACEYIGNAKYWLAKVKLAVLRCKREGNF